MDGPRKYYADWNKPDREFQNVHESIFYGEFKGEKMGMGEIIDRFECEAEDPTYYALSEQPLIEF